MWFSNTFSPDRDIPDLSGKVILVTGGNIGLGKESILQLSKHNPKQIFLGARSEPKALAAIESIKKENPKHCPIDFLQLDLASFDSIKKAAAEVTKQTPELHVLMNNAGIMASPAGQTAEGYELQFGTNHMGHALLTKLLLPLLLKTASAPPTADGKKPDVRVVNLSSAAEAWGPRTGYDFALLKTDAAAASTWSRYGTSKVANIHHARCLARRHPELRCVSVHPGAVNTNLSTGPKQSYPWLAPLIGLVTPLLATSVQNGAKNQLWAATNPEVESGEFYWPVGVKGKGTVLSKDDKEAEKLWEWTEKELEKHV